MSIAIQYRTIEDKGTYSSFELALALIRDDTWQEWPAAYGAPDNVPMWHDWQRNTPLDVPRRVYRGDGRVGRVLGSTVAALAQQLDRWAQEPSNGFLLVPVHDGQARVAVFLLCATGAGWTASRHAGWTTA